MIVILKDRKGTVNPQDLSRLFGDLMSAIFGWASFFPSFIERVESVSNIFITHDTHGKNAWEELRLQNSNGRLVCCNCERCILQKGEWFKTMTANNLVFL